MEIDVPTYIIVSRDVPKLAKAAPAATYNFQARFLFNLGASVQFNLFDSSDQAVFFGNFEKEEPREIVMRTRVLNQGRAGFVSGALASTTPTIQHFLMYVNPGDLHRSFLRGSGRMHAKRLHTVTCYHPPQNDEWRDTDWYMAIL